MRKEILEKIKIPEGVSCEYFDKVLKCKKDSNELSREMDLPQVSIKIENNELVFECKKGNKKDYKNISSCIAHVKNLFFGLNEKFVYELEAANVHFPMTLKQEGSRLIISNFLGEKVARYANILPNVDVQIKGLKITISSHDKESAGQTAANFEKATKLKGRDRRVFQDGIFLVKKATRGKYE